MCTNSRVDSQAAASSEGRSGTRPLRRRYLMSLRTRRSRSGRWPFQEDVPVAASTGAWSGCGACNAALGRSRYILTHLAPRTANYVPQALPFTTSTSAQGMRILSVLSHRSCTGTCWSLQRRWIWVMITTYLELPYPLHAPQTML
jgi:hypothetical protein